MTANCRRCHGFGSTLAPASRRIVNFLRFGRTAAIAGRSTPGSTPITNIEITIAAPVFPAETKAVAFPLFHELGRDLERRVPLVSERVRRALRHPHDLRGVSDLEPEALRTEARRLALDGGAVTHENDGGAELPDRRHRARDDDRGAVVAPHGVDGNLQARPLRRR